LQPRIAFQTDAGLQAGSTKQEIAEALGVAMAMNAGAALHLPAASQQTAAGKGAYRHEE